MPRLITLTVIGMLFLAACTQEDIYTHDPVKLEKLESAYQTYLNHYNEPVVGIELLEKIKTLAIELGSKEYLATYYGNHAYLSRLKNQYGEAIKSNKQALTLYEQLNDSLKQANIASNLGNVYRLVDKSTEAIRYFEQAKEIYIKLGLVQKLPKIYDNISLVYMGLEQYDKAQYYISKSLEASFTLDLTFWMYNAHMAYGELYFRQQQFDEAISNYKKGLTYLDNKQQLEKAYLHGNIGECYMKAGNLAKAEKWLNEALQLKNALDGADKRPNFNYLGELAVLKADYKAALTYYDQVVELSTTDSELLSEELIKALDALEGLDNNTSARASGVVVPMQKYRLVRDKRSKLVEEQKDLIESRYIQEDIDKAELEIARMDEAEKHKQDMARKDGQMQLWYAIAVALIAIIIYLSYRVRKYVNFRRQLNTDMSEAINVVQRWDKLGEEEKMRLLNEVRSRCR